MDRSRVEMERHDRVIGSLTSDTPRMQTVFREHTVVRTLNQFQDPTVNFKAVDFHRAAHPETNNI